MATPICPKCSAELRDDYGMAACPSCGAIVFIDMDGVAHIASDENASEPVSSKASTDNFPESSTPVGLADPQPAEALGFEALAADPSGAMAQDADLGGFEPHPPPSQLETMNVSMEPSSSPINHSGKASLAGPGDELSSEGFAAAEAPAGETPSEMPGEMNEDFADFFGEGHKPPKVSARVDPKDPLGVSGYADNELSQAKGGGLLFKLRISGIDSKELREDIRQALKDSRFGWSLSEVMGPDRLRGGILVIPNLNAVKTSIIVNRIKHLPVEIRWEQYAITDVEGPTS